MYSYTDKHLRNSLVTGTRSRLDGHLDGNGRHMNVLPLLHKECPKAT